MKRIAFLGIGILISVVSLYFALRGFDLNDLWNAMLKVQFGWLLLMVVPYVLTFMTKVWRWRVLFHPDEGRYSIGTLFSCLMISYVPLPFRAGEVARGAVFAARTGTPVARVLSTIVVEKVLDVLALLFFLGVSLPFVGLPSDLQGSATVLGAVFLVVALVLLVLVIRPDLVRRLAGLVERMMPVRFARRISDGTEHALQGLAPLSNPPIALRLGLWSLATWGVNSVALYCMLRAFNLDLPPMAAVTLMVATNLGMAVPSAPGYVGPFEFVVVSVLTLLGVAKAQAQSFALAYHVIGLVPVALIGVISVFAQGIGLAAFRSNLAAQVPEQAQPDAIVPGSNGAVQPKVETPLATSTIATQTQKAAPGEKR